MPAKAHIKDQKETFDRFNVQWTPTQLVLDPDGTERHRIEGFLPLEDFLAQLELGLAKRLFQHRQYGDAEKRFRSILERYEAGAAPEAAYWAGVSAYKASNDPSPLGETAKLLEEKYPESEWTRKASVWKK